MRSLSIEGRPTGGSTSAPTGGRAVAGGSWVPWVIVAELVAVGVLVLKPPSAAEEEPCPSEEELFKKRVAKNPTAAALPTNKAGLRLAKPLTSSMISSTSVSRR